MDNELFRKFLDDYLEHLVIQDGCWHWDGYIGTGAQPKINVYYKGKNREYSITRFSYLIFLGIDDRVAKNICLDRFCSNPYHRRDYLLRSRESYLRLEKDQRRLGIERREFKLPVFQTNVRVL